MQTIFDLAVAAVLLVITNRWYELERSWAIIQHPYLAEQNEQLNKWLKAPKTKPETEVYECDPRYGR